MKQSVHGGNIYQYMAEHNHGSCLDYSANINPLGLSEKGRCAMMSHFEAIVHYPDPHCTALLDKIANYYHVEKESILLGNGAAELIFSLSRLPKVRRIMTTAPAFSEYGDGAKAAGIPIDYIFTKKENGFALTVEDIDSIDWEGTLFFAGNPNNPDGQLLDREVFFALVEAAKGKGYVAIDESFIDFIGDDASYRQYIKQYDHLIIIHSFTKFYAVPGLRIGALFGCGDLLHQLSHTIPTWSVNTMAQFYMLGALEDEEYKEKTRSFIKEEQERVYALYAELEGVQPLHPSVNFMLMELKKGTVDELQELLLDKGILIRNANTYDNLEGQWFRIAIKDRANNDIVYEAIKEYVHG